MGATVRNTVLMPLFALACAAAKGQVIAVDSIPQGVNQLDANPRKFQRHDTVWIYSGICKTLKITMLTGQPLATASAATTVADQRKPLLDVSGEASYQRFERDSKSDDLLLINTTSDVAALRLNLVYKETYPFTVFVRRNQSRPFQLDNQYEVNIGFDNRSFRDLLQQKISASMKSRFIQQSVVLLNDREKVFRQLQEQKEILQNPAFIQQQVEARMRGSLPAGANLSSIPSPDAIGDPFALVKTLKDKIPSVDSLKERLKDSVKARIDTLEAKLENKKDSLYAQLEKRRDSLQRLLHNIEDSITGQKEKYNKQLDSLNRELSSLQTTKELQEYADRNGIKDSLSRNRWADLLSRTSLRFGKFILNSSELTVNNIFLHGLSVRYGDTRFVQLSVGYYDFAFRELFNFRNDSIRMPKKFVTAIKLGKTDGKNLQAINFYLGRKEKAGNINGDLRTVAGVSVERKFHFNKNVQLDLEIAKSTTRMNSSSDKDQPMIKDLFTNFNTRVLGGYGALKAFLPKTRTDIEMSYRYWGQQFESFNASQYFNPQNNANIKLSQPLFHRKLYLTGGVRYTDFKTYGIASNLRSKTLFASSSATLRLKKFPVLSVGYYPGSQLYWMESNKLYEYFYYILNGTASHYFHVGKVPMQAVATYNKFFNKYTDSLVSGSQSYYNIFWTAWIGRFSCQASYSHQDVELNRLSTVEGGLSYSNNKFRLGGTAKWNFFNSTETRMGYSANVGLLLGKIGTVNLVYDRSFLPSRNGVFLPVTTGQVQIIKPLKFRIWQKS